MNYKFSLQRNLIKFVQTGKTKNKKRMRKVYKTKLWKVTKKGQTFDSIFLKMETVRNRLLALK